MLDKLRGPSLRSCRRRLCLFLAACAEASPPGVSSWKPRCCRRQSLPAAATTPPHPSLLRGVSVGVVPCPRTLWSTTCRIRAPQLCSGYRR
ncbi:hypothetical protein T484DRAFT_1947003 [Baffinella frigidus]|nr:hypothetical protein T484DRAFT_1947003 [Cryptophyta sp. CCMP2293]